MNNIKNIIVNLLVFSLILAIFLIGFLCNLRVADRADIRFLNRLTTAYESEVEARMEDLETVATQRYEALVRINQLAADRVQLERELADTRDELGRMGEELEFANSPVVVATPPSEAFLESMRCWPVTSDPCLDDVPTQAEFNRALLWCLDVEARPVSSCVNLVLDGLR
jgi:hypothetical protein